MMHPQRVYQHIVPLHAAQMGAPSLPPCKEVLSHVLQSVLPLYSVVPQGQPCFLFMWNAPGSPGVLHGDMDVDPPVFLHGEPMEVDPPVFLPSTCPRQPMVIDSPTILPSVLARQEPIQVTQTTPQVLPPVHLPALEDQPTADPNREIDPAPVVDTHPNVVQSPIIQPIESEDAEVVVPSNWDYREGGDAGTQTPSVTPTTLEDGERAIREIHLDGTPIVHTDDFNVVNFSRLLQFKDYHVEDLTNRMERLAITDDFIPPGPCTSTLTASGPPTDIKHVMNAIWNPGHSPSAPIPSAPIPSAPTPSPTPSVSSVNTIITTEVPPTAMSAITATEVLDTVGNSPGPVPTSSVPYVDAAVTEVPDSPASQPFHIFSDLERPFDEKKFSYLSALEGYEPPINCLLPNHRTTQDASPGFKDRPLGRFGTFGEGLKAKMAQTKHKEDHSLASFETPTRIIRTRKTKTPRRHPYQCDLTPLPSTNHMEDPFKTNLKSPTTPLKKLIRYKALISDSVFKDIWAHIPSPPPSPTLSWKSSRAERKVRSKAKKATNLECIAEEPILVSVVKTDDSQTLVHPGDSDSMSTSMTDSDDATVTVTEISDSEPSPRLNSDSDTLCTPPEVEKVETDIPCTPSCISGTLLTPQSQPSNPIRYKLLPPGFDSLPPKVKTVQSSFVIKNSETDVIFLKPTALSLGGLLEEDQNTNVRVTKPDDAPVENSDASKRNRTPFSRILGLIYGW